jgi:4-carboxymuconolactone decarboxylase
MRTSARRVVLASAVPDYPHTLRRLAVADDQLVATALAQSSPAAGGAQGDQRMRALCRLAALIARDGTCPSYESVVESALAAGASVEEIVDVLFAVAGTVGSARVIAAAPLLARAVGFDVDEAFDCDQTVRHH